MLFEYLGRMDQRWLLGPLKLHYYQGRSGQWFAVSGQWLAGLLPHVGKVWCFLMYMDHIARIINEAIHEVDYEERAMPMLWSCILKDFTVHLQILYLLARPRRVPKG